MTYANHQVQIDRPIEEVFDFLADGTNNSLWQPKTVTTSQVEETLGAGTTFHQLTRHLLGFITSWNYRVASFDRPHELKLVATSGSPMRPIETFALKENGQLSTLLSCSIEYRPEGKARFFSPMLRMLRPLFVWEASWINDARDVMERNN